MLRKFFVGWTAVSMLLVGDVLGQLPNLPPSLPKPAVNTGAPLPARSTAQPVVSNTEALASAPTARDAKQLPVPAALSGVKTGQSETAVSVGTSALSAASIPSTPSDGSKETLATAEVADLGLDVKTTASITPPSADQTHANQDSRLTATGRRDAPIRPSVTHAGSESIRSPERTSFKTLGPTIQVETLGPRSIAINKPAEFEIRVTNSGTQEARGINVEASFPEFVDLMNARPSTGGFDQQNQPGQPRMKWRIESLPPGQSATATLQVTPRSAQLFDFQVQWSADPLRGQAAIHVTEPKLDMRIAGPAEVQYGETAIYTVTIRNPGTGAAENVEIMLSEDLGGQRASVGNIQPGEERNFEVELIPGDAGSLSLEAFAKADTLEHSAKKEIIVRRGDLEITLDGPPAVYAGTTCIYRVKVKNVGDAIAREVVAAAVLPIGAKYIGGIESAEVVNSGLRWNIGNLPIGEERSYEIQCSYSQAGDLSFETGVRAADDLAATHTVRTQVAALADLVLSVESPKGPLPIQEQVTYLLKVKNRGTSAGKKLHVAMQFSEGIEPVGASGASYAIEPGQITFTPIESLEVDQEITIRVQAIASDSGNHRFRAVLTSDDPVCEEIAQGTTRFYGSEIISDAKPSGQRNAEADAGLRR
ncbi:MAG: CARDB domain-containing protein [Pirellulaceae bacterium]|nr:CARDB domain-containing protein [Pirellulaceae bacterium]